MLMHVHLATLGITTCICWLDSYLAAITTPIIETTIAQMKEKKTCSGTRLPLNHCILLYFVVLFASLTSIPTYVFAYSSAAYNLLGMFLSHQIKHLY